MQKPKSSKERLIVALDYDNLASVTDIVERLGGAVEIYKVGLEVFFNTDAKVVDYLKSKNKKIFLDLKFHDITNTVKKACEYAINKDLFMFNIHVANGSKTMKEVASLLKEKKSEAIVIGVTVLTNLNLEDINEIYLSSNSDVKDIVENMAKLSYNTGLHGIVCSAKEAKEIKKVYGDNFVTVCPGIRPSFSAKDDQVRVMTPYEAIKNGADYLVIGRPITAHENPKEAVAMIYAEMDEAINN